VNDPEGESVTDLLPIAPDELSVQADPTGYMEVMLHRAKGWLQEARNIDDVRDAKAIAVGYVAVIKEKELAFDAQLAATEIVRRCERRVGELVRQGQDRGEIRGKGQRITPPLGADPLTNQIYSKPGPYDFAHPSEWNGNEAGIVQMTDDVPREQFDAAIEEAKAEGNLSRANVVRKVKGEAKPAARSEWHHKKRHLDANRIVERLAMELDAATVGLDLIDPSQLDADRKPEWVESIRQSIGTIQKEIRKW